MEGGPDPKSGHSSHLGALRRNTRVHMQHIIIGEKCFRPAKRADTKHRVCNHTSTSTMRKVIINHPKNTGYIIFTHEVQTGTIPDTSKKKQQHNHVTNRSNSTLVMVEFVYSRVGKLAFHPNCESTLFDRKHATNTHIRHVAAAAANATNTIENVSRCRLMCNLTESFCAQRATEPKHLQAQRKHRAQKLARMTHKSSRHSVVFCVCAGG